MSSTERKPSVSNWFSSLRRQPKNKKTITNVTSKNPLQKSCGDLSAIDCCAANTASPSTSVTNSPKLRNGFFPRDLKFVSALRSFTPPMTTISKTETLEIDQQKEISAIDDKPVGTSSKAKMNATRTTTTAATIANQSQQQANTIQITTKTKITQTTVITKQSHRVGLIFNDNGELISNLSETYKNLANNLSNQLKSDLTGARPFDVCSHLRSDSIGSNNNNNSRHFSDSNAASVTDLNISVPFKSNSLEDDIEYIDSSSSLSDIGSCSNSRLDLYYNTLPKPKICATCKTQSKSQSEWNISVQPKVD